MQSSVCFASGLIKWIKMSCPLVYRVPSQDSDQLSSENRRRKKCRNLPAEKLNVFSFAVDGNFPQNFTGANYENKFSVALKAKRATLKS